MVLGFDLLSWYGAVVAAALAYLLWASVLDTGHRHFRAVKRRVRPPAPSSPLAVLDQPEYSFDTETASERRLEKARLPHLARGELCDREQGRGGDCDGVTTGVRLKDDGREHAFVTGKIPALVPRERKFLRDVAIPRDLFDGLTDHDYYDAFLFWARFTGPGAVRWEVVYDPVDMEQSSTLLR